MNKNSYQIGSGSPLTNCILRDEWKMILTNDGRDLEYIHIKSGEIISLTEFEMKFPPPWVYPLEI